MRNAPNVKLLPKDPFTEAIIFAGSDAWSHVRIFMKGDHSITSIEIG